MTKYLILRYFYTVIITKIISITKVENMIMQNVESDEPDSTHDIYEINVGEYAKFIVNPLHTQDYFYDSEAYKYEITVEDDKILMKRREKPVNEYDADVVFNKFYIPLDIDSKGNIKNQFIKEFSSEDELELWSEVQDEFFDSDELN